MTSLILLSSSCSKTKPKVTVTYTNSVDGTELVYHEMNYTNDAGNTYNVMRLKYILSQITLHSHDGSSILLDDIHFVDSEDEASMFGEESIEIPVGAYDSLSFIFGLDETMNVSNAYLAEPMHASMAWPDVMGGGYHYMRLEGAYQHSDGTQHFYNTHTGRWQEFNNYIEIGFPLDLYANSEEFIDLNIDMNVNKWYTNPHTYNFENFEAGIMGNLTAQDILSANGVDVFSVQFE